MRKWKGLVNNLESNEIKKAVKKALVTHFMNWLYAEGTLCLFSGAEKRKITTTHTKFLINSINSNNQENYFFLKKRRKLKQYWRRFTTLSSAGIVVGTRISILLTLLLHLDDDPKSPWKSAPLQPYKL